MSSEDGQIDPVKSVAEGVTKAVLDWSSEKIKEWVTKFRNKELAFVEDQETIKTAKEQRSTSEWNLFIQHIEDKRLRILFQMGLAMRKLEKQKETKKISDLKRKIMTKYGKGGLHVANVVQNGIFSKYIGNVLDRSVTPERLKLEIESLFFNIEERVVFIRSFDKTTQRFREIVTKIQANSPDTFIISSIGSAMKTCEAIKKQAMEQLPDYTCESYGSENKQIYFLNNKNT